MARVERRGSVRVPARLAMEIRVASGDVARAETMNVSANGVYFLSTFYIAPLPKLRITLDLAMDADHGGTRESVACDGVFSRTQPDLPDDSVPEYQIACYFTEVIRKTMLGHHGTERHLVVLNDEDDRKCLHGREVEGLMRRT